MRNLAIMQEIQQLPLAKKFDLMEEIIKSIRKEEMQGKMEMAVNELYEDYTSDKELTAFTSLDLEHFYEAR